MEEFELREIGARIAQARLERGFTQEQLAEIGSFSKRSLQDYEAGVTIPYRHLRELGRLLKRKPEWFLYGDEPEPEPGVLSVIRDELQELAGPVNETNELVRNLLNEVRKLRADPRKR